MKAITGKFQLNLFWKTVLFYGVVYYGGLVFLFPRVSQWAVGASEPLGMPGASLGMYRILILLGLFVYVASSASRREAFLVPIHRFMGAPVTGWRARIRRAVLVLIPLTVGGLYFLDGLPRLSSPAGVRIQHPTMPRKFEKMANPFRESTPEAVQAFLAERAELAEEEQEEEEAARLKSLSPEQGRALLVDSRMREGAALYAINCRPCHGMQANGAGPMARGFRLKPANFTDPGLLPTVVEPYAFWRVSKGGPGLPAASTPWDSAMPIWEMDLSEEDRWKILLGEYFLSGVNPREPEKHE